MTHLKPGVQKKHSFLSDAIAYLGVKNIQKIKGISLSNAQNIYAKRLTKMLGYTVTARQIDLAVRRFKKEYKIKKIGISDISGFLPEIHELLKTTEQNDIPVPPWMEEYRLNTKPPKDH